MSINFIWALNLLLASLISEEKLLQFPNERIFTLKFNMQSHVNLGATGRNYVKQHRQNLWF